MIDPRTVMLAMPCYGSPMPETMGSVVSCHGLYHGFSAPTECSHVSLVRNLIAAQFLASPYEWLICWDNDIAASRQDFELLLEPCITSRSRFMLPGTTERAPQPSREVVQHSASLDALDIKTRSAADILVCAEYSYKNDALEPVKLGMGFVRIHRSVFERLQLLKHPKSEQYAALTTKIGQLYDLKKRLLAEGREEWALEVADAVTVLENNLPDPGGGPRLWQIQHKGRLLHDYYPSGPLLAMIVPTAEWKGEDHGFFTLCYLAGIIPRIETRTRLVHIGRKAYRYLGPDLGGGQ